MDFFETVRQRHSVRAFKEGAIPQSKLERMVDCARLAATGNNYQPWTFVVVQDEAKLREFAKAQAFMAQAAAVIAIVADTKTKYWVEDCSAACEHLLLAATALGYGACWVQGTMQPFREQFERLLKIPPSRRLFALVPVGIPAHAVSAPPKRSLQAVLKWETFD